MSLGNMYGSSGSALPPFPPFNGVNYTTNGPFDASKHQFQSGDIVKVIGSSQGNWLSPKAQIIGNQNSGNFGLPNWLVVDLTFTLPSNVIWAGDMLLYEQPIKKIQGIDLKKLDPLVIDPDVLEEIKAVLKQHVHREKLFDDWGLKDVIEYGRGMTFLFYGTPGTGKTWAAKCIARACGRELLTIGAAEIQTSEPGGANRNIINAFEIATKEEKVLLLDECDSLITVRDDVGMIIGSEINTLLTEIEKFEGIAILATNRVDTLDDALERRIALIVEFPEPNQEQRKAIWGRLLPKKLPLHADVSLDKLSEHKLTDGQIKNVVLQAARIALSKDAKEVSNDHFMKAVERVIKSKSLLGTASRHNQGDYDVVKGY